MSLLTQSRVSPATPTFITAAVYTANSEYIVHVRPDQGVKVICPDGKVLTGTHAYGMVEGFRFLLRDNDRDLTVLCTTEVRMVCVAVN